MKTAMEKPRIFVGLWEVAGYYSRLVSGLRELGYTCSFVTLTAHAYAYGEPEKVNIFLRCLQAAGLKTELSRWNQPFRKIFWSLLWLCLREASRIPLFIWALCRHDIFILRGMFSFLFFLELPLLRLFGKRVIWVFHGTESRPAYLNGKLMRRPGKRVLYIAAFLVRFQRALIRFAERYVNVMINHPPTGHFHTVPFVQFLCMGIPTADRAVIPGTCRGDQTSANSGIRILHCPSHAPSKGTAEIREAVRALREEGLEIDFRELRGVTNETVLKEIARCDFIIDQVYSDTPMAGFPAEAACAGKPAVVGGYYGRMIHDDVPSRFIPPTVYCEPEQLKDAVRDLATCPRKREEIGQAARSFIVANWSTTNVAGRFVRLFSDDIPPDWFYDPARLTYTEGYGMPESWLRDRLTTFLDLFGPKGLCLEDKPRLRQRFLEMANDRPDRQQTGE